MVSVTVPGSTGDMEKSVYDPDNDGFVELNHEVSDDLVISHDAEINSGAPPDPAVLVLEKTITFNVAFKGAMRIKFDLGCRNCGGACTGVFDANAQIYKNGVAWGTLRQTIAGYTTFSEDFTIDLSAGDTVELYCSGTWSGRCYDVKNFRIYFKEKVIATTNS